MGRIVEVNPIARIVNGADELVGIGNARPKINGKGAKNLQNGIAGLGLGGYWVGIEKETGLGGANPNGNASISGGLGQESEVLHLLRWTIATACIVGGHVDNDGIGL